MATTDIRLPHWPCTSCTCGALSACTACVFDCTAPCSRRLVHEIPYPRSTENDTFFGAVILKLMASRHLPLAAWVTHNEAHLAILQNPRADAFYREIILAIYASTYLTNTPAFANNHPAHTLATHIAAAGRRRVRDSDLAVITHIQRHTTPLHLCEDTGIQLAVTAAIIFDNALAAFVLRDTLLTHTSAYVAAAVAAFGPDALGHTWWFLYDARDYAYMFRDAATWRTLRHIPREDCPTFLLDK